MKKLLIFLFSIVSFAALGQAGSIQQSGIFLRVNDTTAYQSAAAAKHAAGYYDIYFNNQATTPHFDIWNGSSYTHVFDFNTGGGGLTPPIDATDIADGSVTDTEFQYLDGVTSDIQTQIDGKQDEFTSQTAATVYAAPGSSSGVPAFLSLTPEHLATLNASRTVTSGSASVQSDNLHKVYLNSAGSNNMVIDLLAVGTEITFINIGAGTWTLTQGSGVTLPGGSVTVESGANAVVVYRVAATPDVYTGTAASGTVTSVGLTIGTSGSDVNVSGSPVTTSGSITLNIPDAGASARGVVTTGTQTFGGTKTITVANTPAGGIAATTVQTALNELDTEKENTANKATSFSTLNSTLFPTTQAVADELLFFKNITAVTGSSGVDASIKAATALDRIPTTSTGAVATGTNVAFISSGVHYIATLKAGTFAEAAPYIVRPNDYATTTNEKYWEINQPFQTIYLPQMTAYLGSTGSDGSIWQATAIDRIPTTSMSVGVRISAIITISGTQRRLYYAELVTPADATANIELSPAVIRPNDFNASTNNKVWREIHMNGIIDVSNFGVVPDPSVFVSDQIGAIITAASSNATLVFPSGDYKIFAITLPNAKPLNIVGLNARFILSTLNANHFIVQSDHTKIKGITFVGQGKANATYPAQGAVRIVGCSNIQISDCTFDSMPNFAIETNQTHISDQSSDFGGINIVNCTFTRCKIGFNASTRGEYVNIVGCTFADNATGMLIDAGNINVMGNIIVDNSTVGLEYTAGINDGHGIVTGNQINHNVLSIKATGLQNGQFFRNNNIYYGDMEFMNCDGIEFIGNTIEALEMKFDSCYAKIENNILPGNGGTLTLTTNWNGGVSNVFTANNKNLLNAYVSGWNQSTVQVGGLQVGTSNTAGQVLTGAGTDGTATWVAPSNLAVVAALDKANELDISGAVTRKTYEMLWVDVTTNSGNTDVAVFSGYTDATAQIEFTMTAVKTSDGAEAYSCKKIATFHKDGSASATLVGTVTTVHEMENAPTNVPALTISMSGANVRAAYDLGGGVDTYRWTLWAKVTITQL